MIGLSGGELLLVIGASIMAVAVIGAIIAYVIFHISGKRLKKRLKAEYGPKRHG